MSIGIILILGVLWSYVRPLIAFWLIMAVLYGLSKSRL